MALGGRERLAMRIARLCSLAVLTSLSWTYMRGCTLYESSIGLIVGAVVAKIWEWLFFEFHVRDAGAYAEEAYMFKGIKDHNKALLRPSQSSPYAAFAREKCSFGPYAPTKNRVADTARNVLPPFPNGWFRVCSTVELQPGKILNIEMCGLQLICWRSSSGKVSLNSAFCPHLGAHLGGGFVVGESVECPFHGWRFDCDGSCVHIPYAPKPPSVPAQKGTIASYPVCEINGSVFMWHHCDDEPPSWEIPVRFTTNDLKKKNYLRHGSTKHHIATHILEVAENGADTAHLNYLHGEFILKFLALLGIEHDWQSTWEINEREPAYCDILVRQRLKIWGKTLEFGTVVAKIEQIGPGIVTLKFSTPLGDIVDIQTITPIAPYLISAHEEVFAQWWVPRFMAKIVIFGIDKQLSRDIPIWDNKVYTPQPLIVKEDGPISRYRRWTQQFFSENSAAVARRRCTPASALDW